MRKLPDEVRDKKIELIKKYGSPNVFEQFDPQFAFPFFSPFFLLYVLKYNTFSVTLAYDKTSAPEDYVKAVQSVNINECKAMITNIAIAYTGDYGSGLNSSFLPKFVKFMLNFFEQKKIVPKKNIIQKYLF